MSCGSYGRPSPDGNIRLYQQSECDAMGGTYHASGECTKKEGGSFSWDCRGLNSSSPVSSVAQSLADSMPGSSSSSSMMSSTYLWIGGAALVAYFLMK